MQQIKNEARVATKSGILEKLKFEKLKKNCKNLKF